MDLGLTTALISLLDMLVRAKPGTCDQRFWANIWVDSLASKSLRFDAR